MVFIIMTLCVSFITPAFYDNPRACIFYTLFAAAVFVSH